MIKNGTGSEYKLRLSRVEYFRISISISLYFFFFFSLRIKMHTYSNSTPEVWDSCLLSIYTISSI